MIHQKKRKNKASFGFFGRFRNVLAVSSLFRPYWPAADTTRYGRYGPILAESARFGMNRAASARIKPSQRESEKKKKKNADADQRTGNRIGLRVLRQAASDAGAAPLVPHPCFLDKIRDD